MDESDSKKYKIFENILQKINQRCIALSTEETKKSNKFLEVIDQVLQKIRQKNTLFNELFQSKFYGGSFYDNLKVGKPNEYDLDCLLVLPKILQPAVKVTEQPGFVSIVLQNIDAIDKQKEETAKYDGLKKLLVNENMLSTKKVKSWMESLVAPVVKEMDDVIVNINGENHKIQVKFSTTGPAMTLKLYVTWGDDQKCNLDVDLVPCFLFSKDQWPTQNYRENPSKKKETFFVVPKSPTDGTPTLWRLSFQEQERELLSGFASLKPTIRLIKKIRDRYQHIIASYYIKTVFLWELENHGKELWQKPLSFVFMVMLRIYAEYLERRNIPYFWNKEHNLIANLTEIATSCIANKIRIIYEEIDRNTLTNPYNMVFYFVTSHEINIEDFKKEAPLSKKQMKQLEETTILVPKTSLVASPNEKENIISINSSEEEIRKTLQNLSEKVQICEKSLLQLEKNAKLQEEMNKKILGKLDEISTKIEKLTSSRSNSQGADPLVNDINNLGDRIRTLLH